MSTERSPGKPTAPRRLPKLEREQQLLDVAEKLFIAKGYDRTSIEDVARAAGVTRPIVYEHHGSKEGLYVACVKRARDGFARELAAALADVGDPREQLRIAGDVFFRILERDPERWVVLFGGAAVPLIGVLGERLTELRFQTVAGITARLRSVVADGDPERIEAFAQAVSGVGEQLGRWWMHHRTIPRARVVAHYTEFIWRGLQGLAEAAPGEPTSGGRRVPSRRRARAPRNGRERNER